MSKKAKKVPSLVRYKIQKKIQTKTPEEKEKRHVRAIMRFKAIVRLVIENLPWLQDTGDFKISDNVMKNIQLLTRKKAKTSSLTLQEKAILNKRKEDRTEEDKQILNRAIGGLKCFRRYPPNVKAQLAAVTYFCFIPPGRNIVKQDHKAHAMYFMLSGEAAVTVRRFDKVLNETVDLDSGLIEPGTMFGEVALIHDIQRLATITTITPCELLMIKKEDFDIVLKDTVMKAWEEIHRILNKFSYFKNWDNVVRRECSIMSRTKVYSPEETILGDGCGLPDYVYFISKGSCSLIEHIKLKVYSVKGIKKYQIYKSERSDSRIDVRRGKSRSNLGKSLASSSDIVRKSKVSSNVPSSMITPISSECTAEKPLKSESCISATKSKSILRATTSKHYEPLPTVTSKSKVALNVVPTVKDEAPLYRSASKYLSSTSSCKISTDPPDVETHFIKVCHMIEGACFNIGENFINRRVVAKIPTNCLLIPRYWILRNNQDNIWNKVQQFLNQHIPNTEKIFQNFLQEQRFIRYRKRLIRDLLSEKKIPNSNSIHNVPYSIRLREGVDVDYGI